MSKRCRITLLLILLLALILRVFALDFHSHHPDEGTMYQIVRKMLKRKTLSPTGMSYGSFAPYLEMFFVYVAQLFAPLWDIKVPLSRGRMLTVMRVVSLLASLLTVLFTALLARAAWRETTVPPDPVVGPRPCWPLESREELDAHKGPLFADRLAALFMAVSFLAIQLGHYATVDSLMTFLATASVVCTFRFYDSGRTRDALLAGLLAGLATATKYTGCLAALPLGLALLFPKDGARSLRQVFLGGMSVPVGFLVGMPYALLNYPKFLKALRFESKHYATGAKTIFAVGPDTLWWNLEFLYYTAIGPAIAWMALLGMLWLITRWRASSLPLPAGRRSLLLLLYPIVVFVFVSRYPTRFDRNLLPLLPFLCIFAALYLECAWRVMARRWRRSASILLVSIVLLSVAYPLARDIVFDWQITQKSTKTLARKWVKKFPKGTRVQKHGRHLSKSVKFYQEHGFDYLMMSSHSLEPIAAHPERFPRLYRLYRELFSECKIVKTFRNPWFASDFFTPHHLLNSATVNIYHGPTMMVLEVPEPKGGKVKKGRAKGGKSKARKDRKKRRRGGQRSKEKRAATNRSGARDGSASGNKSLGYDWRAWKEADKYGEE